MNPTQPTVKHIFVVEDDVFLGNILTQKVKEAHIEVSHFMSAEDMLKALETVTPDVILLDIYLPGLNGLVALDKLRQQPHTKDICVIIVSNTDEKKDRDEAARLNAKFLIKAITDPEEIIKTALDAFTASKS